MTIADPSREELRKFGLITGAIVVTIFGLCLPWLFDFQWPVWPWILAGVLWVWGLTAPATLIHVYRGWMKFGQVAGWINTRIILAIMFYGVFLPTGIILKILRVDPMGRKMDHGSSSYRILSDELDKDHVERPY